MKNWILLIVGFVAFNGITKAQFIKTDNLFQVNIVDPSQLYYNYQMSLMEKDELHRAIPDQASFDHVMQHCTETGWPAEMNSFEWRNKHMGFIKSLKAFYVAELSDFLTVLIIPKANNESAFKKAKMDLSEDIYLLIPAVAIRR